MDILSLASPICAAAIVSVATFALMWKADQIEKSSGVAPIWMPLVALLYIVVTGFFCYPLFKGKAQNYGDIFGAALAGNLLALMVLYLISSAFFHGRVLPARKRILPTLFAMALIAAILCMPLAVSKPHP